MVQAMFSGKFLFFVVVTATVLTPTKTHTVFGKDSPIDMCLCMNSRNVVVRYTGEKLPVLMETILQFCINK